MEQTCIARVAEEAQDGSGEGIGNRSQLERQCSRLDGAD